MLEMLSLPIALFGLRVLKASKTLNSAQQIFSSATVINESKQLNLTRFVKLWKKTTRKQRKRKEPHRSCKHDNWADFL